MALKHIDLSLPEWTFLEATSHLGNTLDGRDLMLHIPTLTVIEVLTGIFGLNPNITSLEMTYKRPSGITEQHTLAVHRSAHWEDKEDLKQVLEAAATFYAAYLKWEDNNINIDHGSRHN